MWLGGWCGVWRTQEQAINLHKAIFAGRGGERNGAGEVGGVAGIFAYGVTAEIVPLRGGGYGLSI